MKKFLIISLCLILFGCHTETQTDAKDDVSLTETVISEEEQEVIQEREEEKPKRSEEEEVLYSIHTFIQRIKNKEIDSLAANTSYPLRRGLPLPDIKNKEEFIERYAQVFDDSFSTAIIHSNIEEDWSKVGDKGIMFDAGSIWITANNGHLFAVNYLSKWEKEEQDRLIQAEKENVHPSLLNYEKTEVQLRTKKFQIRIDKLPDGKLRYASWGIKNSLQDKPDLVLYDGKWLPDGSGGNSHYEFNSGNVRYLCHIIVLGTDDSPPALLEVYDGNKKILSQDAEIIRN